jgi:hypothetical protein
MRANRFGLVFALLCTGCSSSPSGVRASSSDYGESWPFTVPGGTIECQRYLRYCRPCQKCLPLTISRQR